MEFCYNDYATEAKKKCYPKFFLSPIIKDRRLYESLLADYRKSELQVETVHNILKERTTSNYYEKMKNATKLANMYSEKVFPLYKYILPDAMIDDWLSTVDPHNIKHPARDHSLHQTLTAYIVGKMLGYGDPTEGLKIEGKSLLQRSAEILHNNPKAMYLRDYIKEMDDKFDTQSTDYDMKWALKVVYETAIIAALFHDMGYPWQFVNKLSSKIKDATYKDVNRVLLDAEVAYETMKGRLLMYPFYGYDVEKLKSVSGDGKKVVVELIRKGLLESHGMPGALSFMNLNKRTEEKTEDDRVERASFRLILDWAALAIMMHDMPRLYWGDGKKTKQPDNGILRLDFEKDPISCIVSIADILEEFNRPWAEFVHVDEDKKNNIKEHVNVNYDYACGSSELEIVGKELTIRYYYGSEGEREDNEKNRKDEVDEYLNEDVGFIDFSSLRLKINPCEVKLMKEK